MIQPGSKVEHDDFGIGEVVDVLGETATVVFFGERIDVHVFELKARGEEILSVAVGASPTAEQTDQAFRKSFEAVNLGIVPSNPDQLINLTIGGEVISDEIRAILANIDEGASRIFMGNYGSGKSHHLSVVKANALQEGWVTASVELDPKEADPARPSTVYRGLTSNLEFPLRSDGSRSEDFFDLVKEVRDCWMDIRSLRYFNRCPWFRNGFEALLYLEHRRDDPEYMSAVDWLSGQVKVLSAIQRVTRREGYRGKIPRMPQTKDNGLIYAYLLTVLHEVLQKLGYTGLALIIDEAEHVRSYSANRYLRASNFFDILSRCAHAPRGHSDDPKTDFDWEDRPKFWAEGPHFGLFIGLTEGENAQDLAYEDGEMSALIRSPDDFSRLKAPGPDGYEIWVEKFLTEAGDKFGPDVAMLRKAELRQSIARLLRDRFEAASSTEIPLRYWTKLAGLPVAVLLSQPSKVGENKLLEIIDQAAQEVAGGKLPWE